MRKRLDIASRKYRRMFSQAVSKSIVKTLTEPITNSWDSYKRLGLLRSESGIISKLLALKIGDRLDHDEIIRGIRPLKRKCRIIVKVAATMQSILKKRQCQVIDMAEGLTKDELEAKFEEYGADKSMMSEGASVRGLFGQGVSDVLWGHKDGKMISIKDNKISELIADFDEKDKPEFEVIDKGRALKKLRSLYNIEENGTCVDFILAENKCRIPNSHELLYGNLCNFYMLRLINANPCCDVLLEQHRSSGILINGLSYNFPGGQAIGRFNEKLHYENYPPVNIEAIIFRADDKLNGENDLDVRENGLLIVDERDAVYDLTLFDFDKSPGLEQVFGVVRLTGFREIAHDRLQNFHDAIITDTRDGLDRKHDFYKALVKTVKPHLDPILTSEKKRVLGGNTDLSSEMKKKVDKALEALNSLYTAETGETGEGPGITEKEIPEFDKVIFYPSEVTLKAGTPRIVYLLGKIQSLKKNATIVAESKNPDIIIEPEDTSFKNAQKVNEEVIAVRFKISSTILGAKGKIEAITEGFDGNTISTTLWIRDVRVPPELTIPDDGMEFRPAIASAGVHRKGILVLYVDSNKIPVESEIMIRIDEGPQGLSLLNDTGSEVPVLSRVVKKGDIIKETPIAKIPIHFIGHGQSQKAKISAKIKIKPGEKYKASAVIKIREPQMADSGIFKDVKYGPLPDNSKRSSLFDPMDGIIWINSKHPTNRGFFGLNGHSYREKLESDSGARIRWAELVLDEAMYHTLARKQTETGERGWVLSDIDPVGSIKTQIETWKFNIGAKMYRALIDDFHVGREN